MPPKRRSTGGARVTPTRQQAMLSFHGKASKVTKPTTAQQAKSTKKDPAQSDDILLEDIKTEAEPDLDAPTTAEKAIEQQAEEEAATLETAPDPLQQEGDAVKTEDVLGGRAKQSDVGAVGGKASGWLGDEEVQARKVPETQIRTYWKQKEQARLAPRVHQQDLSVHEKVLREWDMSGQYGPCIGIARLKRWKRANKLGLHPPIEVLAILLRGMDGGDVKSQRAHVDELLSSRFIET